MVGNSREKTLPHKNSKNLPVIPLISIPYSDVKIHAIQCSHIQTLSVMINEKNIRDILLRYQGRFRTGAYLASVYHGTMLFRTLVSHKIYDDLPLLWEIDDEDELKKI